MNVDLSNRKILQSAEKELVKVFVSFCQDNNLKYFIMGGTLLGAVRHRGFIPWDDDIDVGMPRPDYEQLQNLMAKQNDELSGFPFRTFKNSKTTEYVARLENPHIKIVDRSAVVEERRDSWMDIFPIDGMPNSKILRNIHSLNLLRLRLLLKYSEFDHVSVNMTERPFVEKIFIKIGEFLRPDKHLDTKECLWNLDRALRRFSYERSDYVVNFMGAYKLKEMFPRKYYDKTKEYKFDELELTGSDYFDEILTQMYGNNYMYPPSEQVKNKHFTEIVK